MMMMMIVIIITTTTTTTTITIIIITLTTIIIIVIVIIIMIMIIMMIIIIIIRRRRRRTTAAAATTKIIIIIIIKYRCSGEGLGNWFWYAEGVTKIPFCQECAVTLGDTNLWPTPGPILISPTRTFIQANLATTLSELYFLSNNSW